MGRDGGIIMPGSDGTLGLSDMLGDIEGLMLGEILGLIDGEMVGLINGDIL
jgi:hypothetical protein